MRRLLLSSEMANTIQYDDSIFQGWISAIESSLHFDLSSMEVSSKETLSAVRMLQESMTAYVEVLKLLFDGLSAEANNMKALGDSLIKADQKARGHFSGKL